MGGQNLQKIFRGWALGLSPQTQVAPPCKGGYGGGGGVVSGKGRGLGWRWTGWRHG
jgi:hypothetical protein